MNSLQIYNQLQEEEKYLKEKLLEFLQPITERYTTKVRIVRRTHNKIMWFFDTISNDIEITYKPLDIDITFAINQIIVSLKYTEGFYNIGRNKFIIDKALFIHSIQSNDYNFGSIREIIMDIKNNASPIFHKWGFAVAHIEDIEKKFFVATNLEKEIKSISNVTSEKVIDLVKEIESRYVNP
jgi:hypothetical protein